MSRILLTAVGSMAAGPAARRYQALGHTVFGCDIYPRAWTPLAGELDFFQARLATEGEPYVEQLREAVRRNGLDFLIPLTDPEVDALAPRKAEFRALGCTVCVPEERVAALCRRKDKMNRFLAEKQVCRLIPTEIAVPGQPCPFPFPAMVKPRSGRSSLGQAVAADEKSYQTALAGREDCIVQPFLEGDIFCVDVARDAFGHTRAAARQELLRNKSGLGMTVEVLPGHPLEAVCAAIAEAVRAGGRGEHGVHPSRGRILLSGGQPPLFRRLGLLHGRRDGFRGNDASLPLRRQRRGLPSRAEACPAGPGKPDHSD